MTNDKIDYIQLRGTEIQDHIPQIAALRISVFREWPYLYDGSQEYEMSYLKRYSQAKNSLIILAQSNNKIIGASSCIWLPEESEDEIKGPFINHGYNLERVVYFGESILLPTYRGRGVGSEFMRLRELFAKEECKADTVAFCSVIRPEGHKLRPADYVPLTSFWKRKGFLEKPGMSCKLSWKDIDQPSESVKSLQFWIKTI